MGCGLADIVWWVGASPARTTRRNLEIAYPELSVHKRETLGRQSLRHTAMLIMESGVVSYWPEERWRALIGRVEGLVELRELLDVTKAQAKGVLLLAPHLGNWEVISLMLGPLGVTALYEPPRFSVLEAIIKTARERSGANLVPTNAAGMRRFYQALRSGGLVALLPDQVPSRESGIYAPFFSHPTLTMSFAHRLIAKTGCIPVLGYVVRTEAGFDVHFERLSDGVSSEDSLTSVTQMNAAIETAVRAHPEQYQWEYKRFRRPPRGERSVYD